jgi:hypothetical protein
MNTISKDTANDIIAILNAISKPIATKLKIDLDDWGNIKQEQMLLTAKCKFLDSKSITLADFEIELLAKAFANISEHFAVFEMKLSSELAKQVWEIYNNILT